jgi:hypothetical protein
MYQFCYIKIVSTNQHEYLLCWTTLVVLEVGPFKTLVGCHDLGGHSTVNFGCHRTNLKITVHPVLYGVSHTLSYQYLQMYQNAYIKFTDTIHHVNLILLDDHERVRSQITSFCPLDTAI